MTPALRLYRAATTAAGPLVLLLLAARRMRGKEDAARMGERFGAAGTARPPGPLVWIHAASVGEATSALALIDRLRRERPEIAVLVTTGTVSSARLLAGRLTGERTLHQYVPMDRPAWVRRFLDHWRPDLALWIESELWPALIAETRARGIPMVLLNGRMSARSFSRWQRLPSLAHEIVGSFALCLGQDDAQADRLRQLGARQARSVGDLKAAAAPLPVDAAELAQLCERLRARKLWLAASTHPGEDEAAAEAHAKLSARHPGLLTIIAPRHPRRGDAITTGLAARGLRVARRSRRETIQPDTDVLLVDTLGELGLFYRLARIVFVGGSLTPMGGHNPLEAARLGCAVIQGPDTTNCAAVAADLVASGAMRIVADTAGLIDALDELLGDAAALERRCAAAEAAAARHGGVLDAVLAELAPFLGRLAPLRDVAAA